MRSKVVESFSFYGKVAKTGWEVLLLILVWVRFLKK